MKQPAKLPRGRKPGSTKAKKELAEKLRRQGRSNEQIADALGISPRTVTRYLTPSINPELSLEEAMKTLSAKDWMRLFKLPRSEDAKETQTAFSLSILRLLNHPLWNELWNKASLVVKLRAIGIKRLLLKFKGQRLYGIKEYKDLENAFDSFEWSSSIDSIVPDEIDSLWNKNINWRFCEESNSEQTGQE